MKTRILDGFRGMADDPDEPADPVIEAWHDRYMARRKVVRARIDEWRAEHLEALPTPEDIFGEGEGTGADSDIFGHYLDELCGLQIEPPEVLDAVQPQPRPGAGKPARRRAKAVPASAYAGQQLSLFQSFLATDREPLSNAIDLWDALPRYAVPRERMGKMRTADGFLDVLELSCNYRGKPLKVVIHPARVRDRNGQHTSYYPSAREEFIEHALRKIATEQQAGFFDAADYRSGVRFSVNELRKELQKQGHAMDFDEVLEGLDILSLSAIEVIAEDSGGQEGFARSAYLPGLAGVRRQDFEQDRGSRWVAHFHPLVTRSIDQITYRQLNYERMMKCRSQLARWLLLNLVLKFTQAALSVSFEVRYSTVKRDSALLGGYSRERDGIAALDAAWEEVRKLGALTSFGRVEQLGPRGRIEDVVYTAWPSPEFVSEQKAANRRANATEVQKS